MVVFKGRERNISPCLRVSQQRLNEKTFPILPPKNQHMFDLSDPIVVSKQLRHMEYLGNPASIRLDFLFNIEKMQAAGCSRDSIREYNEQVRF